MQKDKSAGSPLQQFFPSRQKLIRTLGFFSLMRARCCITFTCYYFFSWPSQGALISTVLWIVTFLGISSIEECRILCEDEVTCIAFTHFGSNSHPIPEGCLLFSSCREQRPCKKSFEFLGQNNKEKRRGSWIVPPLCHPCVGSSEYEKLSRHVKDFESSFVGSKNKEKRRGSTMGSPIYRPRKSQSQYEIFFGDYL